MILITKDIFYDGEDYQPPMWLAASGDLVELVVDYGHGVLLVSKKANEAFKLYKGEYSEQLCLNF